MQKIIITLIALLSLWSCKNHDHKIISTNLGDMEVLLLDSTPKHKENFTKLVNEGFYDGLLFHRVINGFMIQGGDPESKNATIDKALGGGGPDYTIPAEIGVPHFKGMLSGARMGNSINPEKASSGSQFFIVQGGPVTDSDLDAVERTNNIKYSQAQRDKYKKIGGYPNLDGEYTVFGEVVKGLDVLDKIAGTPTDSRDRPTTDIVMKIK